MKKEICWKCGKKFKRVRQHLALAHASKKRKEEIKQAHREGWKRRKEYMEKLKRE